MKLIIFFFLLFLPLILIGESNNNCGCKLNFSIKSNCIDSNSTFKVLFKDGKSKYGGVGYARLPIGKDNIQKILVCFEDNTEETYQISEVESFVFSSIGPGCNPIVIPVLPAYIYYLRDDGGEKIIENYDKFYIDLFGSAIYDFKSSNKNFKTFLYGGEVLLGFGITRNLSIAFGAGIVIEDKRNYFPIKAELRYHLFVDDPTKNLINYKMRFYPDNYNCKIRDPYLQEDRSNSLPDQFNKEMIVPLDLGTELDSTVYWVPDIVIQKTEGTKHIIKPYLYAEGGLVLDGSFDGAGKESQNPYITINPDEYSEFMFGIGVGAYFWDFLNVSLGYRYLRLNYRQPCKDENCFKYAIITNDVMGACLRIGLHLGIF